MSVRPLPAPSLDERLVREIVRDELRAMLARLVGEHTYSTKRGHAPEGYSRDEWRALAHEIGVQRGRYYYVTAAQLAEHERKSEPQLAPAAQPARPWHPSAIAGQLGLRRAGGER